MRGSEVSIRRIEVGLQLLHCRWSGGESSTPVPYISGKFASCCSNKSTHITSLLWSRTWLGIFLFSFSCTCFETRLAGWPLMHNSRRLRGTMHGKRQVFSAVHLGAQCTAPVPGTRSFAGTETGIAIFRTSGLAKVQTHQSGSVCPALNGDAMPAGDAERLEYGLTRSR